MSLIRDTRECARLFALKTVHGLHPHARSGKREKSGDTSSRAASQPSSRVGCGASDFCKKCVSTSVIDAIKERWAAHDKSDHQREVHPNSAERRITGGASLAFCFAMLWINNTQVSDQRPCVSHALKRDKLHYSTFLRNLFVRLWLAFLCSLDRDAGNCCPWMRFPFLKEHRDLRAITQERNTSVAESQTVYAKFDPPCIAWIHP